MCERFRFYVLAVLFPLPILTSAMSPMGMISGKVLSTDGEAIDYATIFLKQYFGYFFSGSEEPSV